MATRQPRFEIGGRIYLRESAVRGFLESYLISQVYMDAALQWKYIIAVPPRPPTGGTTVGDRNTLQGTQKLDAEFFEDELIVYCEALVLAESNALAAYNNLHALRVAGCASEEAGSGEDLEPPVDFSVSWQAVFERYHLVWGSGGDVAIGGFEIQKSVNGGEWAPIATLLSTESEIYVRSASDTSVFRIRAFSAGLYSSWVT